MDFHEYQAKELFRRSGIPVPDGYAVHTLSEAKAALERLGPPVWVVKSQIHAGGRGRGHFPHDPMGGGGVRVCHTLDSAYKACEAMLGKILVTRQTGPAGARVRHLYLEAGCDIAREFYLSFVVERTRGQVALIASATGGTDIEETARTDPSAILTFFFDPGIGSSPYIARRLAFAWGLPQAAHAALSKLVADLYALFLRSDGQLLEINPLVLTTQDELIALDGKLVLDDNAAYRQRTLHQSADEADVPPAELAARRAGLSYIRLDGEIGCMINGAGLAMATMDIIKLYGFEPANFLDVGGSATREGVREAFRIIGSDTRVRAILVNIFGGIMKCDVVAEGVVAAAQEFGLAVPMVVRLEGTRMEEGRRVMAQSGLPIMTASDLDEAARKITEAL